MSFEKNMEALRKTQPGLVKLLEATEITDKIHYFMNDNGDVNLAYEGVSLHRIADPMGESLQLFDAHVKPEARGYQDIIFMYGLGLGYMLQRCWANTEAQLLVYEPYLEVLRATLEAVDFSKQIASRRVKFITHKDKVVKAISAVYLLGDNFTTIALPCYQGRDSQHYLEVLNEVHSAMMVNLVGQNTAMLMLESFTRTSLNNMAEFMRYPEMTFLHDRFKGMPGVVVSAGPSLDKPGVLDTLREMQEHCLISCVGQAAQALDAAGIVPDLVNVLEYRDVSQQIEGVSYMKDTNLVLLPQAHRNVFATPSKRKMISFSNKDPLTTWMSKALERSFFGYNHQGTVSISAMIHLMKMGCNPVFLLGQDLGFPEGKMYASNSVYKGCRFEEDEGGNRKVYLENKEEFFQREGFAKDEKEWEQNQQKHMKRLVKTKGWNGEKMYTSPNYDAYRKAFEIIAETNSKDYQVINCSEGGVFINHMEHMPFVEAVEKYNFKDYHPKQMLREILDAEYKENEPYSEDYNKVYQQFDEDLADLQVLEAALEDAKVLLEQTLSDLESKKVITNSLQSKLRKLSHLDEEMSKLTKCNVLINSFIKKEMMEYNRTYARKMYLSQDDDQKGDIEALIDNLESSRLLYKAVEKGIGGLHDALGPVLETFPAVKQSADDQRPAERRSSQSAVTMGKKPR